MPFLHHLHDFISTYGYFAVFVIVALESAGVPMPGETALVSAAIFAGQGALDIKWVIACAAAGGDPRRQCRLLGRPRIRLSHRPSKYGRYIRLDEARLKLGQYLFQRHGGKIVFFGRFVAVLRAFAALLAGINRLAWPRFFLFNALGRNRLGEYIRARRFFPRPCVRTLCAGRSAWPR